MLPLLLLLQRGGDFRLLLSQLFHACRKLADLRELAFEPSDPLAELGGEQDAESSVSRGLLLSCTKELVVHLLPYGDLGDAFLEGVVVILEVAESIVDTGKLAVNDRAHRLRKRRPYLPRGDFSSVLSFFFLLLLVFVILLFLLLRLVLLLLLLFLDLLDDLSALFGTKMNESFLASLGVALAVEL